MSQDARRTRRRQLRASSSVQLLKSHLWPAGRSSSRQMQHLPRAGAASSMDVPSRACAVRVLATAGGGGFADVSPKGDAPGFVHVVDETTLHLPDRLGNNRTESLKHILENPRVGLCSSCPAAMRRCASWHGPHPDRSGVARPLCRPGQAARSVIEIAVAEVRFTAARP